MPHWLFWSIVAGVFFLAGLALFVFGIVFRHRMTEDASSAFSLAHEEKKKTITFGGAIAWPGLGLLCVGIAVACFYWGVLPAFPEVTKPPAPSASPSRTPESPSASETPSAEPTTPPPLEKVAFKTPRGVVCSNYLDQDAMACVIADHSGWGDQDCRYAFTISRTGPASVTKCPKDLKRLVGYRSAPPLGSYGQTYDLGVARCVLASEGTYCVNSDRNYIRVSTEHSYPTVKT